MENALFDTAAKLEELDELELDEEDIVTLQSKLKKVPAKKLAKRIAALQ